MLVPFNGKRKISLRFLVTWGPKNSDDCSTTWDYHLDREDLNSIDIFCYNLAPMPLLLLFLAKGLR